MATGDTQREAATDATNTARPRPWRMRTFATVAVAATLTTAMTTLAVASSTTGPRQALPAAARAQLVLHTDVAKIGNEKPRAPRAIEIPHTAVGAQLSWLLGEFNGGSATITEAELRAHFSGRFLSVVPARALILFLRRSSNLQGSAVVTALTGRRTPLSTTARVAAPAHRRYVVRIDVEGDPHHRITSLTIDGAGEAEMAETVRIGDTKATAKIRNPLIAFALVFLTLGIYHLVWYYKINRELRDLGRATGQGARLGEHPLTSLMAITFGWLLLVPPFVSFYRTMQRIEAAQETRWTRQRVSPVLAFVLYVFGLFALPFEVIYAQSEMNRIWREDVRPAAILAPSPGYGPAA